MQSFYPNNIAKLLWYGKILFFLHLCLTWGLVQCEVCIGDQDLVYKIGPGNRHWGVFAEKCINNRTIRHNTKGTETIVYCLRKMHLWGSKSNAVYSIPLCFYLGWSAYLGTMSKICVWPYYNGYMTGAVASYVGLASRSSDHISFLRRAFGYSLQIYQTYWYWIKREVRQMSTRTSIIGSFCILLNKSHVYGYAY